MTLPAWGRALGLPPHEPHSFSVPAMSLEDLPDAKQGGKLAQGAEPELKPSA